MGPRKQKAAGDSTVSIVTFHYVAPTPFLPLPAWFLHPFISFLFLSSTLADLKNKKKVYKRLQKFATCFQERNTPTNTKASAVKRRQKQSGERLKEKKTP